MLHLAKKTDCSGCGGCRPACPVSCIEYRPDGEGFLYPVIDESRCVGCGRCEAVCPMTGGRPEAAAEVWACKALNDELRRQSSSGGVFPLLADGVLEAGGVVFGAVCEGGKVFHRRAETAAELASMRGSKYVQSDMRGCFAEARECLDAGQRVLFSGTPCQIAGLRRFLGPDAGNEKLLTAGTLCMGVPSPAVWDAYVAAREAEAGGKAERVRFREKSDAPPGGGASTWRNYAMSMEFENGKRYVSSHKKDPYLACFQRGVFLRPACHACRFKFPHYEADLTLGDYWGIESLLPELDDDQGVSLILTHTEKGARAFAALAPALETRTATLEHAATTHRSLTGSLPPSPKRGEFFAGLAAGEDILPLLGRCAKPPAAERVRHAAGAALRKLGLRR